MKTIKEDISQVEYNKKKMKVFIYEFEMLSFSYKKYKEWRTYTKGDNEKFMLINMSFEAFLIHARAILEFFEAEKKYKNDIVITDFLDQDNNFFSKKVINLQDDYKNYISKYLAHMTQKRTEDHNNDNSFYENMYKAICSASKEFFELCSELYFDTPEQRKECIKKYG